MSKRALFDVHYLEEDDITEWAAMPHWLPDEAIILSLGISPDKDGVKNSTDDAVELGRQFTIRYEIITRSCEVPGRDRLKHIFVQSRSGDTCLAYAPEDFVKWAMKYLPGFPEKLYRAVTSKKATPSRQGGEVSSGEPKTLIARRWAPKTEMEMRAEQFALEALKRGCSCSHPELADYLHTETFDAQGNAIFYHRKIKDQSMRNLLVKVVKQVFKEKAPSQVVGDGNYSKPNRPCPVHSKRGPHS